MQGADTGTSIEDAVRALVADGLPVRRIAVSGRAGGLPSSGFAACVPACNEEGRIARCLAALDADLAPGDGIVLLANGCRDGTVEEAGALLSGVARPWLLVDCHWLQGAGRAPFARRLALDIANGLAPAANLLSIDGDTIVLPGLRAAYAAEFAKGYDLVCGQIGFLPEEAALLPAADPASEAAIREYRETSRRIAALIGPDPDNPWPHHGNIGGANFAVSGAAYREAGPLPLPPSGEDRALRRRFEGFGRRIRYSDLPRVHTSCRLDGRASGGLSDELRRNRSQADPIVDELLEPPGKLLLRHRSMAAFLGGGGAGARAAILLGLGLSPEDAERLGRLGGRIAWQSGEDLSPVLKRARLRLSDLRHHLPELRRSLADIEEARSGSPAFPAP